MKKFISTIAIISLITFLTTSCRHDEVVVPTEYDAIGDIDSDSPVRGFYLVNEGNMGSNKCTLDYYDYATGVYSRNFYGERNPGVVMELGDVGNDAEVYGSKLYVVVNCSHKVEVLDAHTGIRLGQIDIPNCRYIRFHRGRAYVSSYIGPVMVDPMSPKGAVFEVDTTDLRITASCTVGYQPEEMAFVGDSLYVANSGGYRPPAYDNTISVIRLSDMTETRKIPVAINLHRLQADSRGRLWASSRGDRTTFISRIYMLTPDASGAMAVAAEFDYPCANMTIHGDSLYYLASSLTGPDMTNRYGIIDLKTLTHRTDCFITDGTEREITQPYGLAIHPTNGDIFVTDAKNYVSSGTLHCYSSQGRRRWSVRTGDIPAVITFTR